MPKKCVSCHTKQPCFGLPTDKVAQYCGICKKEGMIDIKNPKCIVCHNKQPCFGLPTDKVAQYCGICKKEGMIDIKNPRCIVCKNKHPNFGLPTDKVAQYCGICKKEGMIDIKNPRCIVCKNKHPCFGLPTDKVAQYCGICKKEGMINLKHSKCIVCQYTRPNFGLPTDKVAQYCGICKKEGMIDLKNPKCIVCHTKQPCFGLPTDKVAQYCGICKKEGMVDLKHPKCIVCQNKQPNFGLPTDKVAQYCGICKKEGMVDLKHPKCKSEWCSTFISNKYEGYCAYCYMHLFPNKPISRNYKTKELAVVKYMKEQFLKLDIITDKTIHGGCSRRRPDILIDFGCQVIIVEVDENQHTDYDCICENKRIMELSQDVGHRPIVFIRFNPDEYETNLGNVASCWSINKQGICYIKKSKQIEWNERLNILQNVVTYWINNLTHKTIEIIQLFYDHFVPL